MNNGKVAVTPFSFSSTVLGYFGTTYLEGAKGSSCSGERVTRRSPYLSCPTRVVLSSFLYKKQVFPTAAFLFFY